VDERLLTTNEVAVVLNCSSATVRKLVADQQIRAIRFVEHGHWRFVPDDVDALVERRYSRKETDALAAP
jgi:excisionase family DNA binding protein